MKVLLLTHPFTIDKEIEDNYGAFPPLGLAYIAAVLENAGHEVRVLDCFAEGLNMKEEHDNSIRIGLSDENILSRIKAFSPDVIGISNNFTSYYNDAINLAQLIKRKIPEVVLVAGGAHMTVEYKDAMRNQWLDFIIRGEGEYTFAELLDSLMASKPLGNIRGLVWRSNDSSIVVNEDREPIADLDALPQPAYHLLNMNIYLGQTSSNFAYSKNYPIGHMITSRGCLYNCIFCSTSKHFKKFRARSPEKVLAEIEYLQRKFSVREIHFHDDSFLCSPKRIHDLCTGIIERKLSISWQVSQGLTVWGIKPDLLRLMQKSGMYRIGLPVESGSERTLKFIRKPINLPKVLEVIEECNRIGIYTHGNFIIGFPYETKEDIDLTASFIYRSGLDFVKLLVCQPLAGSDLYSVYLKEGLLKDQPIEASTYENTKYDTIAFKSGELNSMRKQIMGNFLKLKLRSLLSIIGIKRYVIPKINSMDKASYFFKLCFVSVKRMFSRKAILGV